MFEARGEVTWMESRMAAIIWTQISSIHPSDPPYLSLGPLFPRLPAPPCLPGSHSPFLACCEPGRHVQCPLR